jgi:hypothetical protein
MHLSPQLLHWSNTVGLKNLMSMRTDALESVMPPGGGSGEVA